jgi:peptidoglycan glycosyltransferase
VNRQVRRVAFVVCGLFVALFLQLNYVQVVAAHRLANDPRNIRQAVRDYSRPRGRIISADGEVIAESVPADDEFKLQRRYPLGALFGHVTGFFSFTYGTTGVEHQYNSDLAGHTTRLRDLRDQLIGKDTTGTVVLSMTVKAQELAQKALNHRRGSVVVMNPKTGEVIALYSEPSFDPNPLAGHHQHEVADAFDAFNKDPAQPMLARSYRERFPPGSTFKVITATTALEEQAATPDTGFPVLRSLKLPQSDKSIANFGNKACGGTLEQSFTVSCNTTFASLGLTLGEKLLDGMERFGVTDSIPFDLPAVRSAAPAPGTFKRNNPAFALAAIGQGDVATPPLQMALVASAVANGGKIMAPHVVHEVRDIDGNVVRTNNPDVWKTAMSSATADTMKQFMTGVVDHGTATLARIPGIKVAGKTGTAQAPGGPPHAWFIGFAPADDPQFAICVLVERGGNLGDEATGGRVAAPVAGQILRGLLGK